MENRAHVLAAGLFSLLLGFGVLVAAMWFSGDTYERSIYVLESRHAVSGLNIQAPVRLRGVEVGKVEGIEFDLEDPRLILVRIGVRSGTPITRGTSAQLGSQGVTGLAYVMLEDDGRRPERLPPATDKASRIPVRQGFLDELSGSGKDLVAEVGEVARRVNRLLDSKNQDQLLRTLATLESATQRVAAFVNRLEPVVDGLPPLTADARKTLQGAGELMAGLTDLSRQLAGRVDTLERTARSAEQVGAAAQSVSATLAAESLPRVHALLDEMARNSRNLDRLLTELSEQPHSLVFGRPAVAPGPGEPGFDAQARSGR